MTIKNALATAVAAFAVGLIAPSETQAQYSHGYSYYGYGSSYGYGSHYGSNYSNYGYSRSYPRYSDSYRKYHHVHGYNHPKYKNRRGKGKYHKPDVSIGPRWDPQHGWVYF